MATPGRLWVHYQETCAYVPAEKGNSHGNKEEVGGDTRHTGGVALDQCGARAHRPWWGWVQGAMEIEAMGRGMEAISMVIEAMGITGLMGIEGRGSLLARAWSSPSDPTGSPIATHLW